MPTLLAQMAQARSRRDEAMRAATRVQLRAALAEIMPAGASVWVFGSLVKSGRFRVDSDIDIAVECLPVGRSEYWLQGELELRLGRRVDVLLFAESRLRTAIAREGERWTL